MPMITCPDCSMEMSDSAPVCLNCGRPNADAVPVRTVSFLLSIGILLIPLIFSWFTLRNGYSVLARTISFSWLLFSLFLLRMGDEIRQVPVSTVSSPVKSVQKQQSSNELTRSQRNAVRSAKQYLLMQGFSRRGLIQQLSADFGDGYKVADATKAIDSLNVDWNEEAVRSAKQYLSMQGFSCRGLIEQLSSSIGDGYTVSEATYGAEHAGACD